MRLSLPKLSMKMVLIALPALMIGLLFTNQPTMATEADATVGNETPNITSVVPPKSKVPEKPVSVTEHAETEVQTTKPEPEKKTIQLPGMAREYTGTKISMDFHNADIHNVFRLIADVSGLNIVISDKVKGKLTLRLIDVPWDQTLDIVMATQGLGMVRVGNIIRIAPAEDLRKEQEEIRMEVQARLDADRKKEELEPLITEYIQVNYAKAQDLVPRLDEIKSGRGRITSDERTNMLIVHDVKRYIDNMQILVGTLDRVTPQVMIEARIVEAQTSFLRELGIVWESAFQGMFGKNTVTLSPAVSTGIGTTAGILPFTFVRTGRNIWGIDAELQAYEKEGKVKMLSAPKVATLDNKEALIKQGQQVPYLQYTVEQQVSTSLVDVVLEMKVTPHITPDGRIMMKVSTKKDEINWTDAVTMPGGGMVPAIDKREAQTELLVNNGETVVMGGVITEKETYTETRVPFLWRIPLLGHLFRSTSKDVSKKELLVFIAPTIVTQAEKMASPSSS